MTYEVALFPVGLAAGLLLVLGHLPALLKPAAVGPWLQDFSRSLVLGRIFLVLAVAWSIGLIMTMDLGEFAAVRQPIAVLTFICGVLVWLFVEEFMAVRALSILLLLAADILLCAAFLEPPVSRLWLVFLAYGWIFGGLFCVGLPWLMRDLLAWVAEKNWRLRFAATGGLAYGLVLVVCAILFWR
jgi:hypothetical protein